MGLQTITITMRDILSPVGEGRFGAGPALEAAIALGREDKVPGPTGTKVARLTSQLRRKAQDALADCQQLVDNYTCMRPKMDGDTPVLDENDVPVLERVPFVKEYKRPGGSVERIAVPDRYELKPGVDVALKAMLDSEISVTLAPFTLAEFDALSVKPEIKEGLLPFLEADASAAP